MLSIYTRLCLDFIKFFYANIISVFKHAHLFQEEKKSLKERLQAIQEVTQSVQNTIGRIATLLESVKKYVRYPSKKSFNKYSFNFSVRLTSPCRIYRG